MNEQTTSAYSPASAYPPAAPQPHGRHSAVAAIKKPTTWAIVLAVLTALSIMAACLTYVFTSEGWDDAHGHEDRDVHMSESSERKIDMRDHEIQFFNSLGLLSDNADDNSTHDQESDENDKSNSEFGALHRALGGNM